MEFIIADCKDKGGISVKPKSKVNLNLSKIQKKYKTLLETPILLVIKLEGEIVVRDYGELLFKELKDKHKVKKIAEEIYEVGL